MTGITDATTTAQKIQRIANELGLNVERVDGGFLIDGVIGTIEPPLALDALQERKSAAWRNGGWPR